MLQREGRADVLPAGPVLPDQKGRPRDRLPDPDLRHVDAARPVDSQRVLLGDQPQPGRDVHARLVLEDRAGRRQRVPLQLRRRVDGTSRRTCSTSTKPRRGPERRRRPAAGGRAATSSAAAPISCCRAICARGRASTTSPASRRSRRSTRTSTTRRATSAIFGGNVVGAWRTYSLNGTVRSQRVLLRQHELGVSGQLAAHQRSRATSGRCSGTPLYFSAGGEYVHLSCDSAADGRCRHRLRSLSAFDFTPQIRYPFKQWQWFTVNSSSSWRDTFYTRSLSATGRSNRRQVVRRQPEPAVLHAAGADRWARCSTASGTRRTTATRRSSSTRSSRS